MSNECAKQLFVLYFIALCNSKHDSVHEQNCFRHLDHLKSRYQL